MKAFLLAASLIVFNQISVANPTPLPPPNAGYPPPGPKHYVECISAFNSYYYDFSEQSLWTLLWYEYSPGYEPQFVLEPVSVYEVHNLRCPFCYDLVFDYWGLPAIGRIRTGGPESPMTMTVVDALTKEEYDVLNCSIEPLE